MQTKKQYITRKENTEEHTFNQEYLNLWQGESEGSLFTYEMFHDVQDIQKAFHPRNTLQIIEKEPNSYKFKDNQVRYFANDIALASGDENDNSVCVLGNLDLETMQKNVEYIKSIMVLTHSNRLKS